MSSYEEREDRKHFRQIICGIVGIIAAVVIIGGGITAGVVDDTVNQRHHDQVKITCIDKGLQWTSGNCIYLPKEGVKVP